MKTRQERRQGVLRAEKGRRGRALKRVSLGVQNALEVFRLGRLTVRQGASYELVHEEAVFRLRRYFSEDSSGAKSQAARLGQPLLLIPPLMLTAEIYDVSPELSAVGYLARQGVDVWVVDFGAPEREEGGMQRTLDDHVRAVAKAIKLAAEATGHSVHLAGYSQGGMFAYQAAAYLQSAHLASVLTFGSPVDIHANLPNVSHEVTQRLIDMTRALIEFPLSRVDGLPGFLTSTGFKLLTPVKEAQQLVDFIRKLHDRQALEKRESRRRFLGGEGFVAWPGPALRKFIDEFVVHNRLASGGFVIDGRSVTMADIRCPVLAFLGERDEFARPPSVRAVRRAAPNAEVFEIPLKAGHFGLVVGSTAMNQTWPSVVGWLRWHQGLGEKPELISEQQESAKEPSGEGLTMAYEDEEVSAFDLDVDLELFVDTATSAVVSAWKWIGNTFEDAAEAVDNLRFQLPRLTQLSRLEPDSRISMAALLQQQAKSIPDATFFLFRGRAFSYADADRRVNYVVRGLIACGVRRGTRVGVLMEGRPSYLSVVAALNRIGAVAVLLDPDGPRLSLSGALELSSAEYLVADPGHAEIAREAFKGDVLVLGGGGRVRSSAAGIIDMEQIDPHQVQLPAWYQPNPGKAVDLAMIFFTSGRHVVPRASHISNRRWAFSAYGAAAACTLTGKDTVYCCLPLHHQSGMLVSVGAALVSGARLALASRFTPEQFWKEVRRYGASVVFYAGEMCRALVNAPAAPAEKVNPLRLFAGSGMRKDVWRKLRERFAVGVLEFYASNEGNAVLANASGEKIGAIGRPLPGATELAIVRYDFKARELAKDEAGWLMHAGPNEPGMLVFQVDTSYPAPAHTKPSSETASVRRVIRGAFAADDSWFVTGDVVRRDQDGDFWYVDRASDMILTPQGVVATSEIEEVVYGVSGVGLAVAYGLSLPETDWRFPALALLAKPGMKLDLAELAAAIEEHLSPEARPRVVRLLSEIEMTDGYRPIKAPLASEGVPTGQAGEVFGYDAQLRGYLPLNEPRLLEVYKQLREAEA